MAYTKDQLKKWSGGSKIRTTYKVPTIKFNGNTGKLTLFKVGDWKNGTEIAEPELTPLRIRRVYTSFEKAPDKSAIRMFTNEHNSWEDPLTVFEARAGKGIKAVGSGVIKDLQAEFPALRITYHVYCLYNDAVHQLVIKGKSRQALVDKQKELARDSKELFEKKFKLTVAQESGPGGNIFYFLNFDVTGDSDLDKVGTHLEAIGKVMDKMDEEYAETNKRLNKEAELLDGGAVEAAEPEDILPVETTEDDNKEIRPEDIPFN
jgi:hypothetical protein